MRPVKLTVLCGIAQLGCFIFVELHSSECLRPLVCFAELHSSLNLNALERYVLPSPSTARCRRGGVSEVAPKTVTRRSVVSLSVEHSLRAAAMLDTRLLSHFWSSHKRTPKLPHHATDTPRHSTAGKKMVLWSRRHYISATGERVRD